MPFDSASDTSRRGAIWLPNWLPFGVEDARNLLSVRFVAIYTVGFESRLSLSLGDSPNPTVYAGFGVFITGDTIVQKEV